MKKLVWPEVAGERWYNNEHLVRVGPDGVIDAHQDVLDLYEKNLSHLIQIVEVDEPAPKPAPKPEVEPEPEPELVVNIVKGIDIMTDGELRHLAKEQGVKLGRTKDRDKIVAKLKKAGVIEG